MARRLTDKQLEELEQWADRIEGILEHPVGDDCISIGRPRLEKLIRMIRAERKHREALEDAIDAAANQPTGDDDE